MCQCHCPTPSDERPQHSNFDHELNDRIEGPPASMQRSNNTIDYVRPGYSRQNRDDHSWSWPRRTFTSIDDSEYNEAEACHQVRDTSHAIGETKRRRPNARDCHDACAYGSNSDMSSAPEMLHSRQWQNPNSQSQPCCSKCSRQACFPTDGSVMMQNQGSSFANLPRSTEYTFQQPSPGQSLFYLGSHTANQTFLYNLGEFPCQILSSSSTGDASSLDISSIARSDIGQRSASGSSPYVKAERKMESAKLLKAQADSPIDLTDGGNGFSPSSAPPTDAIEPMLEQIDKVSPLRTELPALSFPTPSSSLPNKTVPQARFTQDAMDDAKMGWENFPETYGHFLAGSDIFKSWVDDVIQDQSVTIPTMEPNQFKENQFEYPPLDNDTILSADIQKLSSAHANMVISEFDTKLLEYQFDNITPLLVDSESDPWMAPYTLDALQSLAIKAPGLSILPSSSSKRYRHDRSLSYRDVEKDRLLVRWRQRGMSYKNIKVNGKFVEAESTLRGRFRTLTKPKEERVRKPEWGERDVENLLEAVDHFTQHEQHPHRRTKQSYSPYRLQPEQQQLQPGACKMSWKQVADYMAELGSYRFGNATVKKKYLEVMGEEN